MKRYLSRISVSFVTLGLAGLIALTALAARRPFHLVEQGTVTLTQKVGDVTLSLVANGTGTATHLGRFSLHREATLNPTTGSVDDGEATLTAANGDQLKASFTGALNPQTGRAVLTYEWKGGTGRFQNASGATVWLVEIHPPEAPDQPQTYDVVADGVINY